MATPITTPNATPIGICFVPCLLRGRPRPLVGLLLPSGQLACPRNRCSDPLFRAEGPHLRLLLRLEVSQVAEVPATNNSNPPLPITFPACFPPTHESGHRFVVLF